MAASLVAHRVGCKSVLDIGCYTAAFLSLLPDGVEKFGVEPCIAAREIAETRGVQIVGAQYDDLRHLERRFDVVTAFDVVEHVRDPMSLLRVAAAVTEPGGLIVLSTGDADGLTFRLSRLDHYYYMSEHMTFAGLRWFRWAARTLGLRMTHARHFAHSPQRVTRTAGAIARLVAYTATRVARRRPLLYRTLTTIWPFSRAAYWDRAPAITSWPDHVLVALEKPG